MQIQLGLVCMAPADCKPDNRVTGQVASVCVCVYKGGQVRPGLNVRPAIALVIAAMEGIRGSRRKQVCPSRLDKEATIILCTVILGSPQQTQQYV